MIWDDVSASDVASVWRKSSEIFARARSTTEHREALLALKDKRAARFHDSEYMAELADRISKGSS
jgi:hypothetical protein